jgi:lysylphosphatidylglycerol synthetase-like protein (DUF2156 family)
MILPSYSTRTMMLIIAALALAMTTLALALQGTGWAIAVAAILGFAALLLLVHGGFFGLIYAIGSLPAFRDSATPPLVPGAEQESTAARRPLNQFSVGE